MAGRQFANDADTPGPISVSRDQYMNEIPSDQPMHTETTPGEGKWGWGEGHYADDPKGGVAVADQGQNPRVERTTVDTSRADRGKES